MNGKAGGMEGEMKWGKRNCLNGDNGYFYFLKGRDSVFLISVAQG